jgi:uncharacterized protein (TIGR03083 family)
MRPSDLFEDSHQQLTTALRLLTEAEWHTPKVCGAWSVKDVIAHLASLEIVLVDVLSALLDEDRPTPKLNIFRDTLAACGNHIDKYNRREVALRRRKSVDEVLAEYERAHAQAVRLLVQVPSAKYDHKEIFWRPDQALNLADLFAYYDRHKREHTAQIERLPDQR